MYQGTTPTIRLIVEERDLSECKVFVSLMDESNGRQISRKTEGCEISCDGKDTTILIELTQEETLLLNPGSVICQVRWINAAGRAGATGKSRLRVFSVQNKDVISYDG